MVKGIKTGGRQKEGEQPRDKTIRVNESAKPFVERFRNLLDDPDIADIAVKFLDELESMKLSKSTQDSGRGDMVGA